MVTLNLCIISDSFTSFRPMYSSSRGNSVQYILLLPSAMTVIQSISYVLVSQFIYLFR